MLSCFPVRCRCHTCTRITRVCCGSAGDHNALHLPGLWPYWLDATQGRGANDVTLHDQMVVLSGPNMAGKSTFLRAITAAVLLASCGLPVPAQAGGQVPEV
jgi:MutS domain V